MCVVVVLSHDVHDVVHYPYHLQKSFLFKRVWLKEFYMLTFCCSSTLTGRDFDAVV